MVMISPVNTTTKPAPAGAGANGSEVVSLLEHSFFFVLAERTRQKESQEQNGHIAWECVHGQLRGVVVAEVCDELRTDDAAGRPGGKNCPVHDRHFRRTDHVEHKGRHRSEPAAVAEQHVADERAENPRVPGPDEQSEADDLRHEMTHAYLHAVVPNVPLWLDEGLAKYFELPRQQHGLNQPYVRQVAAAVGYVALCGFDRVTVQVFPDLATGDASLAPTALSAEMAARGALRAVRGRKSSMQYFQNLSQLSARGPVDFNEALRRGAMVSRQPGVAVLLSDFLDPAGYETGLNALIGRGFQVNAVQILAPEELNPATYGDLRLIDSESGAMQEVTFGKYRLKAYQQSVQNFCQRLREFCQGRGIRFFSVGSDTSLEQLLLRQLRQAEVWG